MARLKIDYGIDLGTTNSAICRMEKVNQLLLKVTLLKIPCPHVYLSTKEIRESR